MHDRDRDSHSVLVAKVDGLGVESFPHSRPVSTVQFCSFSPSRLPDAFGHAQKGQREAETGTEAGTEAGAEAGADQLSS